MKAKLLIGLAFAALCVALFFTVRANGSLAKQIDQRDAAIEHMTESMREQAAWQASTELAVASAREERDQLKLNAERLRNEINTSLNDHSCSVVQLPAAVNERLQQITH